MKDVSMINGEQSYRQAEEKANQYFNLLLKLVQDQQYTRNLNEDFREWKMNHIHSPLLSYIPQKNKRPTPKDYHHYIKWLNYTNKLEAYLERSISYLYLRDLGKTLDHPKTEQKIKREVKQLKDQLIDPTNTSTQDMFSFATMYRKAQKDGYESAIIWLFEKLNRVTLNIPDGLDAVHAERKLIKIIAGVLMHTNDNFDDTISHVERSKKLDEAIRLGFYYGLTYPFIDDLLDSNLLSGQEKEQFSQLIRTTLTTGTVPPLGENWSNEVYESLKYIHGELQEAFEYIKGYQESASKFFEQAYVFFHSQEVDRLKTLSNPNYTNEEIYLPIILKSSSSRLIARSVIDNSEDEGFENRTFLYGIYNQLADDFADMFDDMENGAVTPYTYYIKYHEKRQDFINPFEMYWAVISNLIHNVYQSDTKTRDVILNRAINGLKRFKEKHGKQLYTEIIDQFTRSMPKFNKLLKKIVDKADDVDFFDKLLRDHMVTSLKNEQDEQEEFKKTVNIVREKINQQLMIFNDEEMRLYEDPLTEAANYSLIGEGKRIRPILTWFMGVNLYKLKESTIMPLLKSLEYMHTASLVIDDLPSQDNAAYRRGRPTVHEVYNEAIAELTGIFLTQKAIEQQTILHEFSTESVLKLIRYTAQVTANMCKGQVMDLASKEKALTHQELTTMCFYKTGLGFEASLIMPAILAGAKETEIKALKEYALHAGIAFQIKDDLLDVEGNATSLGKPARLDIANDTSTFVTVLGIPKAKEEMWEHYCLAIEAITKIEGDVGFLKYFLNYLVNRDH